MNSLKSMQVHRFREFVAVYLNGNTEGKGATIYLTHKEAALLAKAINRTAREIRQGINFVYSTVGTFEYPKE